MRLLRSTSLTTLALLAAPLASFADPFTVHEAARLLPPETGGPLLFSGKIGAIPLLDWDRGRAREAGRDELAKALRDHDLALLDDLPGPAVIVRSRWAEETRATLAAALPAQPASSHRKALRFEAGERKTRGFALEVASHIGVSLLCAPDIAGTLTLTRAIEASPASLLPRILAAAGLGVVAGSAQIWAIAPLGRSNADAVAASDNAAQLAALLQRGPRNDPSERQIRLSFERSELWDLLEFAYEKLGVDHAADDRVRGRFSFEAGLDLPADEALRVVRAILLLNGFRAVPGPAEVWLVVPSREVAQTEAAVPGWLSAAPLPAAAGDAVVLGPFKGQLLRLLESFSRQTGQSFAVDGRVRGELRLWSRRRLEVRSAAALLRALASVKGFAFVAGPGRIVYVVPSRAADETRALLPRAALDATGPLRSFRLEKTSIDALLARVTDATGIRYRGVQTRGDVMLIGEAKIRDEELPDVAAGFLAVKGWTATAGENGFVDVGEPLRPGRGPAGKP